ncbi:MAG: hypothetical protein R3B09_13520 [Nannocystaceae bacterium]
MSDSISTLQAMWVGESAAIAALIRGASIASAGAPGVRARTT